MTDVGTAPPREPASRAAGVLVHPYASWPQRVLSALLDSTLLGGVTWLVAGAGVVGPDLTPGASLGPPSADAESWVAVAPWLGLVALAVLALQGWTGFTPAKRVFGIAVVRADGGGPAGLLGSLLRVLAHVLDALFLVGYLRPLWHPERRTFADSLVGTVVVQTTRLEPVPWLGRIVRRVPGAGSPGSGRVLTGAAVLVCVLGLGFGLPIGANGWNSPGYPVDAECSVSTQTTSNGVVARSASLSAQTQQAWQRRMWVRRSTLDETTVTLRWEWERPDGVLPDIELTAQARADQTVLTSTSEPAWVYAESVDGERIVSEATVTLHGVPAPAALPADEIVVTSSLVADGASVATCEAVIDTRALASPPTP